ncbi:MAG: hypothetical protein ACI9OJ_003940 [Myxococcota bacterium]|jgi:hypothetical protein
MRVEATVPDSRGVALKQLADELGLSKSQVVDEALALFLKVVMEARRGRRFMAVGQGGEAACEIATPSLTQLEWMFSRTPVEMAPAALEEITRLVNEPPAPNAALTAALSERR